MRNGKKVLGCLENRITGDLGYFYNVVNSIAKLVDDWGIVFCGKCIYQWKQKIVVYKKKNIAL